MHPIFFQVGGWQLRSYVVLIGLAAVVSLLYFRIFRARLGLAERGDFWLLVNLVVLGSLVGGKLSAVLFESDGRSFWASIFSEEGPSTFGVLFGLLVAVAIYCRLSPAGYFRTLDYVFLVAPLCHAIARMGCFLNGCCYGRPAPHIPWAVAFSSPAAELPPQLLGVPLHPVQLYEAVGDLAIACVLCFFFLPRVENGNLPRGAVSAAYLVAYGILRFTDDFFRGDEARLVCGLTVTQLLAIATVLVVGLWGWRRIVRERRTLSVEVTGNFLRH